MIEGTTEDGHNNFSEPNLDGLFDFSALEPAATESQDGLPSELAAGEAYTGSFEADWLEFNGDL